MLRGTRAELPGRGFVAALAALAVVALLGTGLGLERPAGAADDPGTRQAQIDAELERLRGEYGEAVADERAALAEYEVSRREQRRLDDEVARLDAEMAATQAQLAEAERRAGEAEAEADRREGLVTAARDALEEARQAARDQAVAAFVGNDVTVYATLLVAMADGPPRGGVSYARAVADHQRRVIDAFDAAWAASQADRDAAVAARAQAQAEREKVASHQVGLEAARADQAVAQAAAQDEVARQRRLLRQVQASKESYETRIAALERESAEVAALLRRRQSGQTDRGAAGSGQLLHPAPGYPIGSMYGTRRHPIFGDTRLHAGIDISAPTGTPVRAGASGEVIAARNCGGYGNCVIIDHGGSLATLSAHLSSMSVRLGDRVTAGQKIGAVGSTGFATGPHLHWEVRVNGTPVNPVPYL